MDRGRTLLIKDVTQLIKFVCIHILFDHEVFKTKLSLNFKETLGTLWSTCVNPVSPSLNAVLSEISSQLTNFYSDVSGHQNTSMDFMCYKFFQINDNVVTKKMMLLVLQLSVICNFFSSIAQSLKEVLIYLNH